MRRLCSPALVLFFLAPAIGELLSGSSPPAEFFNPVMLLILAVLYGGGAILSRELVVRWRKGWPSLFVLGIAYGIVEEGLMVKSFFDPHWVDIGILGSYGRWAGVNWVWALHLTIYHTVFSIAIPILLVELLFSSRRREAWIGTRAFKLLGALFLLDVAFGFFALTPYRPPLVPYVAALAAVLGLLRMARRLPSPAPRVAEGHVARWRWFALLGLAATLVFFLLVWVLPPTGLPPVVTMLVIAGLAVLTRQTVLRMSGQGAAWGPQQQLALAAGALGFFVLLAPLQEMDRTRPDNTAGMTVVGLAMALFLFLLARWVRRAAPARA